MQSLYALYDDVRTTIQCGELNAALKTIHNCVENIITEPLCTAQAFGSPGLDQLCVDIGQKNMLTLRDTLHAQPQNANCWVHIVTKIQNSGGHSRVIEAFMRAFPQIHHIILATELEGKSDRNYIHQLEHDFSVHYMPAPSGNYQEKLSWLQRTLIDINPARTYLFNHHSDSVAVAAIQPEMKLSAWFYHHGDHHLCLGVYVAHLQHIDAHPMGYYNCRNTLGITNTYVPLTVADKGKRSDTLPFMANTILTTCTVARSNKIEPAYCISYLEVIPQLLHQTSGKHIHIGRLSPWALFTLRTKLKKAGVSNERFIYIPFVPTIWEALHDLHVDLLIASFPYGGGLTTVAALGAGIPIAAHMHIFSQVLGGYNLMYPDSFCWRTPDELIAYCKAMTPHLLQKHSALGRAQYERFHTAEIFKRAALDPQEVVLPDDLTALFTPQPDVWACLAESQISLKSLIRRTLYRLFRKIRAAFL